MISTGMRDPRQHAEFFIELEQVTLSYGQGEKRVDALGVTTLRLKQGEFVALVGPSGCGKSTILKLVSGLVPATSGYVYVAGREVGAEAVRVGMAFQNPTMLPWLTVRDNVMMPLKIVPPFRAAISRQAQKRIPRPRRRAAAARSGSPSSATSIPGNCPAACCSALRCAAR